MKTHEVKRYSFPLIGPCSVFTFHKGATRFPPGFGDILYVGCENGHVLYTSASVSTIVQLSTAINVHRGKVSSIHISYNLKIIHHTQSSPLGILFTGGMDHMIRVWNPSQSSKSLIQTLVGHEGIVTCIVEGAEGTIVSCASDGSVRVWSAVIGRQEFLNPYYECLYTYDSSPRAWFTCVCAVDIGPWVSYVADNSGNITSLKKSNASNNESSIVKAQFFEKVHTLSITSMILMKEEDILVTASSDTYCKLIDSKSGICLASIRNNRFGRYEGISWIRLENRLYLTDEFGFLDIFSLQRMTIISTHQLYRQSVSERYCTVSSHKFAILGMITRAEDDHHFFVLLPYSSALSKHSAYNGDIALWRLQVDRSVLYFQGHSDNVISLAISNSSQSQFADLLDELFEMKKTRNTGLRNEETCIVTVSTDQTIRCWDEHDCHESFLIRIPEKFGAPMSSLTIWELNSIITCHDTGQICIWDICSGSMVSCSAFKDSIQTLTLGLVNNHFGVIAADISGAMAFIDLKQFDKNPTAVPINRCQKGFHDGCDPGILSLAYNRSHDLIISGGSDCSIRYGKPLSNQFKVANKHADAVCLLQTSSKFLLSGDISGTMILWELIVHDREDVNIVGQCCWSVHGIPSYSSCSAGQLIVSSHDSVFVVQTTRIDTLSIWNINFRSNDEQLPSTSENDLENEYMKLSGNIDISRYAEIVLENVEITSTQITSTNNGQQLPKYVYCGTSDGSVLRYDIDAYLL